VSNALALNSAVAFVARGGDLGGVNLTLFLYQGRKLSQFYELSPVMEAHLFIESTVPR